MNARLFAVFAGAAALAPPVITHAADAAYPVKNVVIVMPYAAGGSSDIMTRALAKGLTEMWGRNVIVENRAGASGMIGAEVLVSAEMKQLFEREGADGAPMTLAQLADLLPKEIARYRKASQEAGLKPE